MSRFVFTRQDSDVANTMHRYWVNFAKHGNPNGTGQPIWPGYTKQDDELLLINEDGFTPVKGYREPQMRFSMRLIGGRAND
jgi:para-nitrobenzyl esterase